MSRLSHEPSAMRPLRVAFVSPAISLNRVKRRGGAFGHAGGKGGVRDRLDYKKNTSMATLSNFITTSLLMSIGMIFLQL